MRTPEEIVADLTTAPTVDEIKAVNVWLRGNKEAFDKGGRYFDQVLAWVRCWRSEIILSMGGWPDGWRNRPPGYGDKS